MIPDALRRNVTGAWGERGERWLHDLPRLLLDVCREWDLEPGPPYELSYHWVCPVTRPGGSPAVLKLGLPGAVHLRREAAVLSAWDGAGAVRLLAHSDLLGALLMERATPGTLCRDLVPVDDEAATAALLDVGRRLHRPVPADLDVPDIAGYAGDLDAYLATWPDAGPLPRALVTAAAGTLTELLADAPDPVLLHGDLHHDNVLRSDREPWLAIDPHGVAGEPVAEVGPMLYNPDPDLHVQSLAATVSRRVEQTAAALGTSVERVTAWGFVLAVVSEIWTVEDGGPARTRAFDVAR
nr:phosphotransferase [Geodermatophilaceae bacterium]